jgi:hypothetical protein
VVGVVSVPAKQSRNGAVIPGGEQRRFGDFVVAASEECTERDFLSAPTPASASRKQARMLGCTHSESPSRMEDRILDRRSRNHIKIKSAPV